MSTQKHLRKMMHKSAVKGLCDLHRLIKHLDEAHNNTFDVYKVGCKHRRELKNDNDHACDHPREYRGILTVKEKIMMLYCRFSNCPMVNGNAEE